MKNLLLLFTLVSSLFLNAQIEKPLPEYHYIYQLKEDEVIAYQDGKFTPFAIIQTQAPSDSLKGNGNDYYYLRAKRKFGYFLTVKYSSNGMQFGMVHVSDAILNAYRFQKSWQVYLYDSTGFIPEFTIEVKNKTYSSEEHCRCVEWNKKKFPKETMVLRYPGGFYILHARDFGSKTTPTKNTTTRYKKRRIRKSKQPFDAGFIMLNQSEFRHNDSLYAKAWLMDHKGRPYKGKVYATVFLNYSGQYYNLRVPAKQYSAGSYGFEWQVPDSLKIDQTYSITFHAAKNKRISKTSSFKVTHYAYKNYKISAWMSKSYFLPGDSTYLVISATDQNDIPLAGSKAEIRFNLGNTGMLQVPYLSIPDSAFRNLLDTSIFLEPEKETWFRIPDQLLPYIDHYLYAHIKVLTPNNDFKNFSLNCNGTNYKVDYAFEKDGDDIHFKYLVNDQITTSDTVTIRLTDRYFSETQVYRTVLPYTLKNASNYSVIQVVDQRGSNKINVNGNIYPVNVSGTKTRDSLYLYFNNASFYHMNWEVYYRGKRIHTGTDDSLFVALKGDDAVQVVYRYTRGAIMYFEQEHILPATQTLKIQHNLPEVAYPGQVLIAEIQVSDFYGKPVKNVNLTGTSINGQMPVITPPTIPHFPKVKSKALPFTQYPFNAPNFRGLNYRAADTNSFNQLLMQRYLNYRAYYPKYGTHLESAPSEEGITCLQVVVEQNDAYHLPREIWIDGVLRYLLVANDRQRPVIRLLSGRHKIDIRTEKYFIELDSVYITAGQHHILGINSEHLESAKGIRFQKVSNTYEVQEIEQLEKQVLFISTHGHRTPEFIEQDSNFYEIPNGKYYVKSRSDINHYRAVAPIHEGMVNYHTRDTIIRFYFDPNSAYFIDSGKVHSNYKLATVLASSRVANYSGYLNLKDAWTYNEIYRLWQHLDSLDSIKNAIKPVAMRTTPKPPSFDPYTGYGGSAYLQMMYDTSLPVQPNFVWLIHLEKPQYSIYSNSFRTQFGSLKSGWYSIITGSYEQEMMQIDSIFIDTLHRTYLRLDKLVKPLDVRKWPTLKYNYYQTLIIHGNKKTPLYDAYLQAHENPSEMKAGSVNGNVLMNLNPAAYAYVVFMHQDGQTRYLSMANNQGFFTQYNLDPGKYLVQVISSGRQVFFSSMIEVKPEKLLNLQIDCVTDTSYLRKISARTDFRTFDPKTAVYIPMDKSFANIQGTVSTKKGNKPMNAVPVQVLLDGIVVGGALTDRNGNYSICCLQEGKYTLEFRVSGFQMISIQDVRLKESKTLIADIQMDVAENSSWNTYLFAGDVGKMEVNEDRVRYQTYAAPDNFASGNMELETVEVAEVARVASSVQVLRKKAGRVANIIPAGTGRGKGNGIEVIDDAIKEKQRLDEIEKDPNGNKIRKNFRSNAFWQPNLITNKEGKTAFTYTLPDDQTQWVHFFAGINRKRQTVLHTSYTRSYKPLSASLRVPEFVYIGDHIELSGSVRDLTGDSTEVAITKDFGNGEKQTTQMVRKYFRDKEWLRVQTGTDSLKLHYSLKYGNYVDGEYREVPVKSNLIYERKVQTRILDNGQKASLQLDTSAMRKSLRIQSGLRDLMLEEIGRLKYYQYGCNEQTASKLIALVWETELKGKIGEAVDNKKEIRALIDRLDEYQNKDGGWGWYKGSATQEPLTLYIAKALVLADEHGYSNKEAKRAIGTLVNKMYRMDYNDRIQTVMLAGKVGLKIDYKQFIATTEKLNLSLEAQMSFIQLKQMMKLKVDLDPVLQKIEKDRRGYSYVKGTSRWGFNAAVMSLTMQAYTILKTAGGHDETLANMRRFVFDNLGYVKRNTFERAAVINALMEDVLAEKGALIAVLVDGKLIQTAGEFTVSGNRVEIVNQGAGVSIILIEEFQSHGNQSVSKGVSVKSGFVNGQKLVLHAKAGNIETLRVEAQVSEYQQYLVLDVPVPAGCQIVSKPMAYGRETAREYYPDHIVIYFESLNKGTYTFDFHLLPQFNGQLTLMPAMMENMYEPEFFGREKRKTLVVE